MNLILDILLSLFALDVIALWIIVVKDKRK
jgi:hypothetical protein